MFKSIRLKTTVLFILLVAAAELFVGLFSMLQTAQYYHNRFDTMIEEIFTDDTRGELTDAANAVSIPPRSSDGSEIVITETGPDNVENLKKIMESEAARADADGFLRLYILSRDGKVEFSSDSANVVEASDIVTSAVNGEEKKNNRLFGSSCEFALPLMSGNSVRYIVYVRDTLIVEKAVLRRMRLNLIITLLLSIIIALILGDITARSVSEPIKTLSERAKRLAEGDRSALVRSDRHDELGELTNSLIHLAGTRQEFAEKELAEKTKTEKILQNMHDGVMAFDAKGTLTHINPEAQKLINRKYVDDISFNRFFKEINADITLEALQYLPTSNEQDERTVHINNQVLRFNFAPFSRDNSEGGVIVIIHDITKQERLESSRRDFVADVSHELRTPLTVIKSYADILADTPDAEPEVRTRFLDTISSETDRMTKIISDLLTLSKLDVNANYNLPEADIDIRQMLESLVERLGLAAKKKGQKLTYTPINDVPNIKGDRDGLERVFSNIISNALKYTPSGGEIHIFSSTMYNDILVKISDNGIGIPKENLPHIFDRFYRVDKARSRDKGGTGLGLAIAKQTIETAFKGKILITSELNKGTDVTVSIPKPRR